MGQERERVRQGGRETEGHRQSHRGREVGRGMLAEAREAVK